MLGGHTRRIHRLKGSLRVIEYFGGGTMKRKSQRRNKITEGSLKICQEGIEHVQVCTEGTLLISKEREVSKRRHSHGCLTLCGERLYKVCIEPKNARRA
jgi:hypothetical protein